MLLDNIADILKRLRADTTCGLASSWCQATQRALALKSIGFDDFLAIDIPPREMLLDPILPERSLAMLYAPRGIGKTLLAFRLVSQSLAVLRCFVARTTATTSSLR